LGEEKEKEEENEKVQNKAEMSKQNLICVHGQSAQRRDLASKE
jgi:hypothetical protein